MDSNDTSTQYNTASNFYPFKLTQLPLFTHEGYLFCMLIHVNYNKSETNWVYLQHKWK